MTPGIVAAVCYQFSKGEIKFLLVRTKGGKYWTFPKGHIKKGVEELPWHAAKREAGEEAGVEGVIESEPFTHYDYYKGKGFQTEKVAAFLMHVEKEREPDETDRDPSWYTSEEAMEKLSKGRRERFVLEHQRVIKEALVRLKNKELIDSIK